MRKVLKVYSGKAGHCMCGCSGKYTYNPELREEGGKDRGYAVDEDECNERTVKMITKKVYKSPNAVFDAGLAYVDIGARTYAVYFAEG